MTVSQIQYLQITNQSSKDLSILLKAAYIFNAIPYQNPNDIFYRNKKRHPKIHMASQRTLNSPNNLQ